MAKIDAQIIKGFNFKKIEQLLKKGMVNAINNSADIIKLDIENGIKYGRDINGKQFKPLKPSTVHSKRAKNSKMPRRPLIDTGMMSKTYVRKRATSSNPHCVLKPANARKDISKYHQYGTKKHKIVAGAGKAIPIYTARGQLIFRKSAIVGPIPQREWFGISKNARQKCLSQKNRIVGDILRRSWYGK
tara:strand:+ start:66 stop:629 length:564 start_codon:yes stop_codon:yes gene_type:complete